MKIYLIENTNGSISIMRILDKNTTITKELKKQEITALSYKEIKESDIPKDRTYRNAWNKDLLVDMPTARIIQMDKIRQLRDEKLAILDIETLKGIDVQAEKQVLRDLPETFDLSTAKTPNELKILIPSYLF